LGQKNSGYFYPEFDAGGWVRWFVGISQQGTRTPLMRRVFADTAATDLLLIAEQLVCSIRSIRHIRVIRVQYH
jgi:hypothetical protein